MKEVCLSVSLTRDEVVEKLQLVFSTKKWGDLEFVTQDRQFAHIRTKRTVSDVLFSNNDFDLLFIDLHLKELGQITQLIITPSTSGYLLALKVFTLPVLWIIVPVFAVYQEGWDILLKLIPSLLLIQLILWWINRSYTKQTHKIMDELMEVMKPFEMKKSQKV